MITYWLAKQNNAEVLLRWDDLNATRVRPETMAQLRSDLSWLGLKTDREYYQSQRGVLYQQALEKLRAQDLIYPCICTRQQVMMSAPHSGENAGRYPGTCRDKFHSLREAGPGAYWRIKTPDTLMTVEDCLTKPLRQNIQGVFGDIALTHADGKIGYQLSSIVDDGDMGVDGVIRGDDLLDSTPQQLFVAQALGMTPPQWCHLPLVIGQSGRRLAKRDGESRVWHYRKRGIRPERMIGWAFWKSQNQKMPIECSMAEAVSEFDLARVPREPVVLTAEDLAWLECH